MRAGKNWQQPSYALERVRNLFDVNRGIIRDGIFSDICVTDYYFCSTVTGKFTQVPKSGFNLTKRMDQYGGLKAVSQMCAACPANVSKNPAETLAGCWGYTCKWNPETESLFDQFLFEHNLQDVYKDNFYVTAPRWFGLWINSPLSKTQCEFLIKALSSLKKGRPGIFIPAFDDALKCSIESNIELHVEATPPSHVDKGWKTTYAHCPSCKSVCKKARRWRLVSIKQYKCTVCGKTYNPSLTKRTERFKEDENSLQDLLGENYESFVIEFGLKKGRTKKQMQEAFEDIHRLKMNTYEQKEYDKQRSKRLIQYNERCDAIFKKIQKEGMVCYHCNILSTEYRLSTKQDRPSLIICRKCGHPIYEENIELLSGIEEKRQN